MYQVIRQIKGHSSTVLFETNELEEAERFRDNKEKIYSWNWCHWFYKRFGSVPFYAIAMKV